MSLEGPGASNISSPVVFIATVIGTNPTHAARSLDRHLYRERFQIEVFFQRIKRHRRIALRFDKLARNYLAFVHLAAVLVWLL